MTDGMSELKAHPLSEIVPPMKPSEFEELKVSIEEEGQLTPILIYEGMILDGRHRHKACGELGIKVKTAGFTGADPAGEVIRLNLRNFRTLTTGQKAAAALAILGYEREKAKERQRAGGAEKVPLNCGEPVHARESTARAGAKVGVSKGSVEKARALAEKRPDLLKKVEAGEMTLNAAVEEQRGRKTRSGNGGTKERQIYTLNTERGKQVANSAKSRLEGVIHGLEGYALGVEHMRVDRAVSVAAEGEADKWIKSLTKSVRALSELKKEIQRECDLNE